MSNFAFYWLFLILLPVALSSLVLLQSDKASLEITFTAPPLRYNATPSTYEIIAPVIDGSISGINVTGCIVIYFGSFFPLTNTWDQQIFVWAKQGAVAVLLGPPPLFSSLFFSRR
jgi:hypothetical protein